MVNADELAAALRADEIFSVPKDYWKSAFGVPIVDAEVVVRCRDCKYCSPGLTREERSIPYADLVCAYWDSDGLDANDFCSHGERKGESERRNENAE
jgi:hypothetical protein